MTYIADPKRLYIPALAPLYGGLGRYSYAFMRFVTGAILVPHGWVKLTTGAVPLGSIEKLGLPAPYFWAYATACVEFFGAIMLAIGFFTRFAAASIIVEMSVIIAFLLWPNGYFWTRNGYEFALMWLLLCIGIFFRGGGELSVDGMMKKEL